MEIELAWEKTLTARPRTRPRQYSGRPPVRPRATTSTHVRTLYNDAWTIYRFGLVYDLHFCLFFLRKTPLLLYYCTKSQIGIDWYMQSWQNNYIFLYIVNVSTSLTILFLHLDSTLSQNRPKCVSVIKTRIYRDISWNDFSNNLVLLSCSYTPYLIWKF